MVRFRKDHENLIQMIYQIISAYFENDCVGTSPFLRQEKDKTIKIGKIETIYFIKIGFITDIMVFL